MRGVRKATEAERRTYEDSTPEPVYPLYGYLIGSEAGEPYVLYVEDLRGSWSRPDPVYEIMAPEGKWFPEEGTTSVLCADLEEVRSHVGIDVEDMPEREH